MARRPGRPVVQPFWSRCPAGRFGLTPKMRTRAGSPSLLSSGRRSCAQARTGSTCWRHGSGFAARGQCSCRPRDRSCRAFQGGRRAAPSIGAGLLGAACSSRTSKRPAAPAARMHDPVFPFRRQLLERLQYSLIDRAGFELDAQIDHSSIAARAQRARCSRIMAVLVSMPSNGCQVSAAADDLTKENSMKQLLTSQDVSISRAAAADASRPGFVASIF